MKNIGLIGFVVLLGFSCQFRNEPAGNTQPYRSSVIFPLQSEHVHGSTVVELPNGDMLAAWFQGSGERWADDVRIMGARLTTGDTTWSDTFLMADVPGFPDINPILFMDEDQKLWLMWYPVIANQWETSIPMYRTSTDYNSPGAPVWAWQDIILVKPGDLAERGIQPGDRFVNAVHNQLEAYEAYLKQALLPATPDSLKKIYLEEWEKYKFRMDSLAMGKNMIRAGRLKEQGDKAAMLGYPLMSRIGWQTKNKPFIRNGRMILPLYSDGFDCSLFAVSDNWGKTWQYSNPVLGGAGIQPTIAITKDSTLVAYLRDNGPPPQRMQRTESTDRGLTWSIAKDDILPNPGAGFDMVTLTNGDWLMVYNHTEEGRHNLTVAISDDEGKSWRWKKHLENDLRPEKATQSHYPAVIQGKDGRIHTVYSYHYNDKEDGLNKTIKYASFPVSWVKDQAIGH